MLANENAAVGQLTDVITRYTYQGAGAYGPVWDAVGVDIYAAVEPSQRLVVDKQGRDVLCDAKAAVGPSAVVAIEDKVTWNGTTYQVVAVNLYRFSGQTYYQELRLRTLGGD
jgi:hypothetical protein